MKLSKYNHSVRYDGESYLFNAYHRGVHRVEPYVVDALKRLDLGEEGWNDGLPNDIQAKLADSGYIIPEYLDEHAKLRNERETDRLNSQTINLTIAPTIDCNFGCPYCFEGEDKPQERMSEKTMYAVLEFLKDIISPETRSLHVTWFGGEPLLGLPQIEQLTKLLEEHVLDPQNLIYSASIITNGYGLTHKIATKLSALGVKSAQVTIDGTKEYHDKRRFKKGNREGTFDRIVQNIQDSCDTIRIQVRANLDKENQKSFSDLVSYLYDDCNLKGKIFVYPAVMRDDGDTEWEQSYGSMNEYMKGQVKLHKEALKHGIRLLKFPPRVNLFCGSSKPTFWVIAPNGDLHKCWDTINDRGQAVGNVNKKKIDRDAERKWAEWSPFNHEKCKSCNVMPLCMGGCANKAFQKGGEPQCEEWKFGLNEAIQMWIEEKVSGRSVEDLERVSIGDSV